MFVFLDLKKKSLCIKKGFKIGMNSLWDDSQGDLFVEAPEMTARSSTGL